MQGVNKVEDLFGELPFELTEGQKTFLRKVTTSKGHFCLAGVQGAGKSTVMEILAKFYGDSAVFCASTGVASQNIPNNLGIGTAHRTLSLFRELSEPLGISKVGKPCQNLLGPSDLIKVIVVDEAYCLHADHLHVMLKRIERFNKGTKKRKHRKIKLILVGDPLQRLPIVSDKDKQIMTERYGHWLMFKSTMWKESNIETYILDEVKRQKDKVFKACLDVIRYGEESRYDGALKWLNKRVNTKYDRDNLLLAPTNRLVGVANDRALHNNPNEQGTFTAEVSGKYSMQDCPADMDITLAAGLDIITLVNDQEGRFANGSFGSIVSIGVEGCYVKFEATGEVHLVEMHEFTEEEAYVEVDVVQEDGSLKDILQRKVIGVCSQVPIKQASAFTIARSQGRTFTCPMTLDMGSTWLFTNDKMGDFGTSDLLVGLSRATCISNVTLAVPIQKGHIKVCRTSIDYWKESLSKQKSEEMRSKV